MSVPAGIKPDIARLPRRMPGRAPAFAAALIIGLLLAFSASGYHLFQYAQVLIYMIALIGLNLLTGFNGSISLGHGAFFAIGGYGAAILMAHLSVPWWLTLPIMAGLCFIAGFGFGMPALRLEGLYLALATFALAITMPGILNYKRFDAFTGGTSGLQVDKPKVPLHLPINQDQFLFLCCLAAALVMLFIAQNLVSGRVGRAMVALRDHPVAAQTMGINSAMVKATCFGIAALYAGVAGALDAALVGFVAPDSYSVFLSLSLLVGMVVGGLGSLWGMLAGAIFIEFVPNLADSFSDMFGESAKALPWAVYGVFLIAILLLAPHGIAGALRRLVTSVRDMMAKASSRPATELPAISVGNQPAEPNHRTTQGS
ncbi:MAG: branched-chain amino acid ABC transporter permease [Hyphomicrobiales bacterium]|nr:branched-chain amino acid ABC transporter permease [Hyphomicrobiales bacterium]